MKYNTVHVKPSGTSTKENRTWKVSYNKTSAQAQTDRVKTKTVPHALGFYHYPETMSDKKALKALLRCMIKRHEQEIADLRASKDALSTLLLDSRL